ncbi:MAG: type II secretion system protein [Phycisphaerae bacterium]|jgi:MSHA pilin protein MshD|nr:type II secretion system protein [Phycisphaerae bacterium]
MTINQDNKAPRSAGFTLIESAMSILIVGAMLVMVINTLGSSVRGRQVRQTQSRAPAMASQLMAEILQASYADLTETAVFGLEASESGANRSTFDDVDDYHNWSATPQDKNGTTLTGMDGWTRSVTVQYVLPTDLSSVSATDQGIKLITVTVTDPFDQQSSVAAIRSNVGTADQAPSVATTFVTWVGVELQIGTESSDRVTSGTNVLNKVPVSGD